MALCLTTAPLTGKISVLHLPTIHIGPFALIQGRSHKLCKKCSHQWSTGLNTSFVFLKPDKLSICVYHYSIWLLKCLFPCPPYPAPPFSLTEASHSFYFFLRPFLSTYNTLSGCNWKLVLKTEYSWSISHSVCLGSHWVKQAGRCNMHILQSGLGLIKEFN